MHFLLASPSVNNVTITGDYTLPDGSQVLLVSEVLFVSESVVSRLHQVQLTFQLLLTLNEKDSGLFFIISYSRILQLFLKISDASRQRDPATIGVPVVWRTIFITLIPGLGT